MSVFVIRCDATFEAIPAAVEGNAEVKQLRQLVAVADQKEGNFTLAPHRRDCDNVVTVYCNEDAGLIDDAGFNDLGACILDVLGYNVMAFAPLAVRGPLVLSGFLDVETGSTSPLTPAQVEALKIMCKYAVKHNGDLSSKRVLEAADAGRCLFRGEELEALVAARKANEEAKAKKARAKTGKQSETPEEGKKSDEESKQDAASSAEKAATAVAAKKSTTGGAGGSKKSLSSSSS
jgi:hypothetical protein